MTLDYKMSQLEEILDQLSLFTGEEAEGMRRGDLLKLTPMGGDKGRTVIQTFCVILLCHHVTLPSYL